MKLPAIDRATSTSTERLIPLVVIALYRVAWAFPATVYRWERYERPNPLPAPIE